MFDVLCQPVLSGDRLCPAGRLIFPLQAPNVQVTTGSSATARKPVTRVTAFAGSVSILARLVKSVTSLRECAKAADA